MIVIDDGDTTWVQSDHHFRGWYHRLHRNPNVELVRGGEVLRYRAEVRSQITGQGAHGHAVAVLSRECALGAGQRTHLAKILAQPATPPM